MNLKTLHSNFFSFIISRGPRLPIGTTNLKLSVDSSGKTTIADKMIVLIIAAVVGFAIGRVISLVVSQLFRQRFDLNVKAARTLIVLGSGGNSILIYFTKFR